MLSTVSAGIAALASIGLLVLLVLALVVWGLFQNVVRPALEIRRYSGDILEAGVGIATNLDGVEELARTRELALAVPALASALLAKIEGAGA